MSKFVSFGEVMLRLAPPSFKRIEQADSLDIAAGGSEFNVAVDLARLDIDAGWVSLLPDNPLGRLARNRAREHGVDTGNVLFVDNGRLGTYYVEYGSSPRASKVIYDRAGSAIAEMKVSPDWGRALEGAGWFHTSGITPALSQGCAEQVQAAVAMAKQKGAVVSYDLNYRAKLWTPEEAQAVTRRYVDKIDVCIGNEEDFQKVLGISPDSAKKDFEHLDIDYYIALAAQVQEAFGFEYVGISLRESYSVLRNGWSGLLYTGGEAFVAGPYELELIDRVGGGDSFSAGLIYGLMTGKSPRETIDFAVAFSALKHTIPGDLNLVTLPEVEALLRNKGTRIER